VLLANGTHHTTMSAVLRTLPDDVTLPLPP
jgi:hypothetical protein